jgi:glucokinase
MASGDDGVIGLVGDVGGTNARFALAARRAGRLEIERAAVFQAADYATSSDALGAYLGGLDAAERPKLAVVAAAGPVDDGQVVFTNNPAWRISERGLCDVGGLTQAWLINDFAGQALAIGHLRAGDLRAISGPANAPTTEGSAVILGPGTGFGAGARIDDGRARAIATGEGGHTGFSPGDETEVEIVRVLMKTFGRVSVERILSGPGLLNLYRALAELRGETAVLGEPDAITQGALAGDRLCKLALERFCAILGSVAGDFALAFGARAGVYVSGGIAPLIVDFLAASDFRRRFEAKGRMGDYLKPIPTWVVLQPHVALIGAAGLLADLAEDERVGAR